MTLEQGVNVSVSYVKDSIDLFPLLRKDYCNSDPFFHETVKCR